MDGHPDRDSEIQPAGTDPDLNAGWDEGEGPDALSCALGCLGCSSSALALVAAVAMAVVALLLLLI